MDKREETIIEKMGDFLANSFKESYEVGCPLEFDLKQMPQLKSVLEVSEYVDKFVDYLKDKYNISFTVSIDNTFAYLMTPEDREFLKQNSISLTKEEFAEMEKHFASREDCINFIIDTQGTKN